ncbi:Thaumatin-like protein 1 [Orobanche minor]
MDSAFFLSFFISLLLFSRAASGAKITFVNNCGYTVWPGILANAGSPNFDSTGFELSPYSTRAFTAPAGWSGRFWGRTGCIFSESGGSCRTGDCGSGRVECNGAGAAPPATLADITLVTGGLDFYDLSLVDGYNLPMTVEATGGSGMCGRTGCVMDLNRLCSAELRVGEGCKSACGAFGSPEYCCSGPFNSPTTCRPTVYSQMFKSACPSSYSYAYDDPTSTFTCSGADYTVTFCSYTTSQKSSVNPTPTMTTPTSMSESQPGPDMGVGGSNPVQASGSGSRTMAADGSYLAGLAMGDSTRIYRSSSLHYVLSMAFAIFILYEIS